MTTETIRGIVRRVFFSNPEKPWMAGKLATENGREVSFSGKVVANIGDKLELTGDWKEHPKYGKQFEAETGLVKMDESPDALAHLLASDSRFKGLGPVRARKVVDAALAMSRDGELASALKEYPDEISRRANVPLDVVVSAGDVWHGKKNYFDALAILCGSGWSNAQAQAIVHVFGENAPTVIGKNPYLLIGKIGRFGFRTVDAVALKMGIKPNDPNRLLAGVAYNLDRIADNGHTWTKRDALLAESLKDLRPDTIDGNIAVENTIQKLIDEGVIFVTRSPLAGDEIIANARTAAREIKVFERLIAGLSEVTTDIETGCIRFDGPRVQAVLPTLNKGQAKAAWGFANHRISVISGGAGVGKTYTMRAICEIAEENGHLVALCAPTGKAARKLSHATGREARTIHRTLEPAFDDQRKTFYFKRNKDNWIEADLLIVDEFSMVEIRLLSDLLEACGPQTRILFVGDHNQIPSVGAGAILRDLLAGGSRYAGAVHVLTEIVRQAGVLARNTTAILDGLVVTEESPAWGMVRTEKGHEESAAAMVPVIVEELVTSPTPLEPFGRLLDPVWDVQVLAPMRKGPLGTWALNAHLQKLRQRLLGNPEPEPIQADEEKAPKPLVGDRVIWTENDYELDLFNGTQAIVEAFVKGGAMVISTEDGREVTIPSGKRKNVELAYAMTIHKAQGSEWPCVILVCSSSHWIMHDRNLLYTGASRAAESLTIFGDMNGLRHFATERRSSARNTFGGYLVHGWRPENLPEDTLGLVHLELENPLG